MRIRPNAGDEWPTKLGKASAFGAAGLALALTLAACTSGSSSGSGSGSASHAADIQISGYVTGNYTKGCAVGSDSVPNQATVAFPNVAKVSGSALTLVMYVPNSSASATYQASSAAAAVRLTTAKTPTYAWAGNYPGGSGTVTVSDGGASGKIDMTLAPIPTSFSPSNQATETVHVQGSWAGCA